MLLHIWALLAFTLHHVAADMAEVGAFEALFYHSAYLFEVEVRGLGQTVIGNGVKNGDQPCTMEEFLTYIAPTRKVLARGADGRKIPGHWIDLPRWDKVDWNLIESNPDDLEAIAYELIHSNFTSAYAQIDKTKAAANPLGDEKTLTNELALVVAAAKELGDIDEKAKKLFNKVTLTLQAVSDSHRKRVADLLISVMSDYLNNKGNPFRFSFKDTDKKPVRKFREIDMEATFGFNDEKEVSSQMRQMRSESKVASVKDLNRQLNNIDNLQRTRQRLTPIRRRTC
ncbi:hypothetical protein NLG97_g6790 [Lecanicillium saksenae]|uniref:Uncharacterized protein n=1 Tax=Lecanicillium saksenae TaxID=468837 RepID=A0ACC1QPS7_9HYPO|nr:hypothetical protein NLG97_g6790 [Lecanicillium saksenae]